MTVLVIDVGGSNVKILATGQPEPLRFQSGKDLKPRDLVERVQTLTAGWSYDVVSIGYPGTVDRTRPSKEPGNLGDGWMSFDFHASFGRPVRVANDAVMQAIGAYDGGRMLFLGLGTGLGSALISDRVVVPMELGNLRLGERVKTLGERLGKKGLTRSGIEVWTSLVESTAVMLRKAFVADYVVLGGGNARKVQTLPAGVRRGGNEDAFVGGFRLWEEWVVPHDGQPEAGWRVLR